MIIRRARHEPNFTIIANRVLQDERITDSLGLLVYLLSLPSDWEVRQQQLMRRFDCGRDRIQAWLRKLVEAGYVRREKVRSEGGSWLGTQYVVYEDPCGAMQESHDDEGETPDEDLAQSAENPQSNSDDGAIAADHVASQPQPEKPVVASLPQPGLPAPENPALQNKEIRSTNTPPLPPAASSSERDEFDDLPPDLETDWRRFQESWPWADGENRERAKRAFLRLTDRDRKEAFDGLSAYLRRCRDKQRPPQHAASWLRDRVWRNVEAHVPDLVPVVQGTDAFRAWETYLRATGKLLPAQRLFASEIKLADGTLRRGTLKPTLFPPALPARDGPAAARPTMTHADWDYATKHGLG